jgi:hypothetical protein
MTIFDQELLVKSIKQGKIRIKKKNRAEGKGVEGVFFSIQAGIEIPSFGRWLLRIFLEFPPEIRIIPFGNSYYFHRSGNPYYLPRIRYEFARIISSEKEIVLSPPNIHSKGIKKSPLLR